jgi:hypothetical protein
MRKFLEYIKPIIEGDDMKASIRRVLAIFFSIILTVYIFSRNASEGIAMIVAFLILSLLGLAAAQSLISRKIDEKIPPNES